MKYKKDQIVNNFKLDIMIKLYAKKRISIRAVQWYGDNIDEIKEFFKRN
jgi:hypothetical protein